MNTPHITIQSTRPGFADASGIADCDDAILFCRVACDMMTEPMSYEARQEFLAGMIVSVLWATCGHKEGLEALIKARQLLIINHNTLGTPQ